MKNISILLVSFLFTFSCSNKNDERSKIEKEKERLKIEYLAKEELQQEEELDFLNKELSILIPRLENLIQDFGKVETEIEKLELEAQIEVLSERSFETDYLFIWLEKPPKWDYKVLKSFEIKFNPKNETEVLARAKLYLEAKKMSANGIVEYQSKIDSENGLLTGKIITRN